MYTGRRGAKVYESTPLSNGLVTRFSDFTAQEDAAQKYMNQPLYLRAVSEQWTIPRNEIQMESAVGEGSEGIVYKGIWRMMPVAAKSLHRAVKLEQYEHEVSILSHLRHPNLVLFLGACLDAGPLLIVSEFMDGGSLEEYIEMKSRLKSGHPYRARMDEIHNWCVCTGRALAFLHQRHPPLIHRDLKPSNLLLTRDGRLKV
jgi:serine/threonine protein kinase